MPVSHHCASCGDDLTRVRARIDDLLRLPIVRCVRCGQSAVRRASQRRRRVRRVRRAAQGVALLAAQGVVAPIAVGATFASGMLLLGNALSVVVGDEAIGGGMGFLRDPRVRLVVAFAVPLATLAAVGLWHGVSFAHHRFGRAVASFFLVVAACAVAAPFVDALAAHRWPTDDGLWFPFVACGGVVAGSPVALAMAALGRASRRSAAQRRKARFAAVLAARRGRR